MTSKAMKTKESITLDDHSRGDKPPAPSACDTVEGGDSGTAPPVYCQMVSTTIPPDSGAGSTGCCAMVSTTRPPDSGAVSTGCCTMVSTTKRSRSYTQAPQRIINLMNLQSTVNQFLRSCPTCKGTLKLEEKHTVSFATTLEIMCKICILNGVLKKKEILRSEKIVLPTSNKKFSKRSRIQNAGRQGALESEINIRAMMSAFYIGTGGFDIGNVTAFLGIPGGKSWERTYHRHSSSMTKHIMKVAEDEMRGADEIKTIGIAVSYDMGWQKRSTGRVYDSISGHGYIIGCRTGKILGMQVRQTKCKKCQAQNNNGTPAVTHDCMVNWDGGSGAMEAAVAMDLIVAVHDKTDGRVYCEVLVSDDDSTMRSHLQHSDNGGKLDNSIPQPNFLADPSHRIKVMATPLDEFVRRARAPIEHLFDCVFIF
uniref:Mutator-like transposase domain-containing protein n=1 Tax=Proboscia inermis TaxID=420281 RepID=A0A7S0C7E0_9STRA|mmetsp:Transcript_28626/g.28953  ORF Transcript_28626/g.28953 Transcript_28626/m.28953 type:complete len:424 (+) Transcript_28626:103-1374(+)